MAFIRKKVSERREAIIRLPVALVSGIALGLWKILVELVLLAHWFLVVITGRRNLDLANFSNSWITEYYRFVRYMYFTTNERPFPFTPRRKVIEPVKK